MTTSSFALFLLLLAVHGSMQKSTPASPTYRAAVVEFKPVIHLGDAQRTMNENAQKFISFIEQAANKDADIIVFPELGLSTVKFELKPHTEPWTTLIPDPSDNYEPCTNSSIPVSEALKTVACASKKNGIYVAINILEKEVCLGKNDCPLNGLFYFVTNVVFDRNGKIISRVRKIHLYDEFGLLDVMDVPEYSIFETDFGVTFGSIVCLDIMYEEPGIIELRKHNITDFVFTSGWFSTLPFLTSIQMEAGWAYALDVNLLASGYNNVSIAYSGTGIYAGRQGIIAAIIPLNDHEELLIADVPKKSKNSTSSETSQYRNEPHLRFGSSYHNPQVYSEHNEINGANSFPWTYENLDTFKTKVIATDGFTVETLSHKEVKCEFQVNVTNVSPPITYRLFALDGIRSSRVIALGVRVCTIVQCANDTLNSCGRIRDSTAIFNHIEITASYVENGRTLMMPNSLGTNMFPLQNWAFIEREYERKIQTSISLTAPTRNLVTFGLWGRNFEADTVDASAIQQSNRI